MKSQETILASTLGPVVGTGPGAGMALMLVLGGLLGACAALVALLYRPLRTVEATIPDHDTVPAVIPVAAPTAVVRPRTA